LVASPATSCSPVPAAGPHPRPRPIALESVSTRPNPRPIALESGREGVEPPRVALRSSLQASERVRLALESVSGRVQPPRSRSFERFGQGRRAPRSHKWQQNWGLGLHDRSESARAGVGPLTRRSGERFRWGQTPDASPVRAISMGSDPCHFALSSVLDGVGPLQRRSASDREGGWPLQRRSRERFGGNFRARGRARRTFVALEVDWLSSAAAGSRLHRLWATRAVGRAG